MDEGVGEYRGRLPVDNFHDGGWATLDSVKEAASGSPRGMEGGV
jgi:hypothetical protein